MINDDDDYDYDDDDDYVIDDDVIKQQCINIYYNKRKFYGAYKFTTLLGAPPDLAALICYSSTSAQRKN